MNNDVIFKDIKIIQNTYKSIKKYNSFVIGFSGGLDSTVLLDILSKIYKKLTFLNKKITLKAIYINHNYNNFSKKIIKHCKKECFKRKIPLKIIKIIHNFKKNIEENFRKERYKAFYKNLSKGDILILAHHKDDQIETFFLALKRGSGPLGLSGMQKNKKFYDFRIIRPLLNYTKNTLKKYAKKNKLQWKNDPTNKNKKFDRNFLRLKILPLLKNRWPNFIKSSYKSSILCYKQEKLLYELSKSTILSLIQSNNTLFFIPLFNFSNTYKTYILRKWLAYFNIPMPSYKKIKLIWKEIILSKTDSVAKIYINPITIRKFKKHLYIIKQKYIEVINKKIFFSKNTNQISLPNKLGKIKKYIINHSYKKNFLFFFKKKKINKKQYFMSIARPAKSKEKIYISFKKPSNLIYIIGKKNGKPLKKLWKEFFIPYWQRKTIPLVFYNKTLICAIGIFTTQKGSCCKKKKKCYYYWIQ